MPNQKIFASLLILIITILPALITYTYLSITNEQKIRGQLSPICLNLEQEKVSSNQGNTEKIKLQFGYQLCMSCFSRINQNDNEVFSSDQIVPRQAKVTIKQINMQKIPQQIINGQQKHKKKYNIHEKKIITIKKQINDISRILACKDIVQLIDYSLLQNANINNVKSLATEINIDDIGFETTVKPIKQLIQLLGIDISGVYSNQQIYMSKYVNYFGVMQLIRNKINKQNQQQVQTASANNQNKQKYLIQYQYPSQSFTILCLYFLQLFLLISIIFLFTCFSYRYFPLNCQANNRQTYVLIIISGIVFIGLILSLIQYRLNNNNFFMQSSQFLYLGLCLLKMKIRRLFIFIFGVLNFGVILMLEIQKQLQLQSQILQSQEQSLILMKIGLFMIVIIYLLISNYQRIEYQPLTIFIVSVWTLIILFTIKYYVWNDFKSLIAKNILLILSVASLQQIGKIELQKFIETGEIGLKKFQQIKQFQEIEEEIEETSQKYLEKK